MVNITTIHVFAPENEDFLKSFLYFLGFSTTPHNPVWQTAPSEHEKLFLKACCFVKDCRKNIKNLTSKYKKLIYVLPKQKQTGRVCKLQAGMVSLPVPVWTQDGHSRSRSFVSVTEECSQCAKSLHPLGSGIHSWDSVTCSLLNLY